MSEQKNAIRAFFEDEDFIDGFHQKFLLPAIEKAVATAMSQRDEKITALENELKETKEELSTTRQRLDALETYSRRNCLVVSGIPERRDEKTDELAVDLAKAAGIDINVRDLDRSHRIGHYTPGRHRGIIIKLLSYNVRQRLYEARKTLSAHRVPQHPILTREVLDGVFISEFLTPKAQHLLYVARQLRRKGKLSAAYSTNGKVKVRTTEDEAAKEINETSDFQRLLGSNDKQLQEVLAAATRQPPRGRAAATGADPPRTSEGAAAGRVDDGFITVRRDRNRGNRS